MFVTILARSQLAIGLKRLWKIEGVWKTNWVSHNLDALVCVGQQLLGPLHADRVQEFFGRDLVKLLKNSCQVRPMDIEVISDLLNT